MPETPLAQRRRLGRELYAIRQHTPGVNPVTGKRARRQQGEVDNVTTATSEIEIPQTATGGNFIELDPGTYEAVVASIESVDNPFEEDKKQLQFEFEISGYQNEDGTPATKRAWANPVWNGQSKLWKWAKAITGKTPEDGEPFRSSMLVGQACRVFINSGENQKGETITKIVDVLGPEKAKAAPKKGGLVASIKEEAGTVCCVPKCGKPVHIYDTDGNAFCEKHAPD